MLNPLKVTNFQTDRRGATAIEYGLLAGGIALAIIGGVVSAGSGVSSAFCSVAQVMGASPTDCVASGNSSSSSGSSSSSSSSSGSSGSGDSSSSSSSSSSSGSSSSGGDTPTPPAPVTPSNATIAACAASGGAWDGACVDPSTLTAAVTSFCNSSMDFEGTVNCNPDGSTTLVSFQSGYGDDPGVVFAITQDNCEAFGGTYGSQPSSWWFKVPTVPTCNLSGAGNTPYAMLCLNIGWGAYADGTCGPDASSTNTAFTSSSGQDNSAQSSGGTEGAMSALLWAANQPENMCGTGNGKTCWGGSIATTTNSIGQTVLVVNEP